MAGLFVDTWGWLAARDKGDAGHGAAVSALDSALAAEEAVVTTDYVLDETFTLLFRRLSASKARESVQSLAAAVEEGLGLARACQPDPVPRGVEAAVEVQGQT